jgi:hypothetical protein
VGGTAKLVQSNGSSSGRCLCLFVDVAVEVVAAAVDLLLRVRSNKIIHRRSDSFKDILLPASMF